MMGCYGVIFWEEQLNVHVQATRRVSGIISDPIEALLIRLMRQTDLVEAVRKSSEHMYIR